MNDLPETSLLFDHQHAAYDLTRPQPPLLKHGLVRVWTDANGEQREELFRSSLTWEPSEVFHPMARPDDLKYIEVDETVVASFIE